MAQRKKKFVTAYVPGFGLFFRAERRRRVNLSSYKSFEMLGVLYAFVVIEVGFVSRYANLGNWV